MIDISLFGRVAARSDLAPATRIHVSGVKPRRILAMLAADLGSPVTKDELAEGMWEGRPPASYVASVESYVCVLRRSLPTVLGGPALVTAPGGYLLDPAHVRVDLVELRRLLHSLQDASGEPLLAGAEEALSLMAGVLLVEEPFASWAQQVRARLDELVELVVTRAAEAALEAGQPSRALRLAGAVLERTPVSEPACRGVMEAYRALDARGQALTVYANLRAHLLEAVGVEPCDRTRGLFLSILDDTGRSRPRDRDRVEVSALARLLRETLEAGVRPDTVTRTWLVELGRFTAAHPA
jgi:DNA-binding SARP family transcriptional activator